MANFFKNPLVLAETVVGSIVDTRALVLYKQPAGVQYTHLSGAERDLYELVDRNKLEELFTGIDVEYISSINGFNMFGVSYIEGSVDISSDLCDHPTETGAVITDYAIVNPITIKVRVALPTAWALRIYNEMVQMFQTKQYIMVQTKYAMYRNMVIQAMPWKLENATIDRPVVELSLRQVMEVRPQYTTITQATKDAITKSLSPEDTDTVDLGRKSTKIQGEVFQQ